MRIMNKNNKNSRKHNRTITKRSKTMHAIPKTANVLVVRTTIVPYYSTHAPGGQQYNS